MPAEPPWTAQVDTEADAQLRELLREKAQRLYENVRAKVEQMEQETQRPAAGGSFAEWMILELMGHRRLAGRVREVQLAGVGFLRLDIPECDGDPGRTQYISPGSVYALHPVDEATARQAAAAWRPEPVHRWELPAAPKDDHPDDDTVQNAANDWAWHGHPDGEEES